MIRIAAVVPLMLSSLLAKGVEWKSWDEGRILAKKSHKIILLDAVREGCHYCDEMDMAVFRDPQMAEEIQKRFVPVKIVLNRQKMPLNLDVSMTPTFYFISADQKVLKSVPGSWNREDFRTIMGEIK